MSARQKKIINLKVSGVKINYKSAKVDFTTDPIIFNEQGEFSLQVDAQATRALTLTGTSGTANVSVGGTNYLATFATSLTQTGTNFVTAHATTILADEGVYVYAAAGVITFTGEKEILDAITITNVTTNLSGTFASVGYSIDGTANITLKASNDLDAPFQDFDSNFVNINLATAANRMITRTSFPYKYMQIVYDATSVNVGAFRMLLFK
jgi:hypothetical protein